MSSTDQPALELKKWRFTPQKVCLSAQIVNDFCLWRSDTARLPSTGLLFGTARDNIVRVNAFQCLEDSRADRASFNNSTTVGLRKLLDRSSTVAERRNLELVGWFSVQSGLELLQSQLEFHYRHFRRACDLALLVNSEDESRFSAALYIKLSGFVSGTHNVDYRSVRLSAEIPISEPLEARTSPETPTELYAEVCLAGEALDRVQSGLAWKQAALSALGMKEAGPFTDKPRKRPRSFSKVNAAASNGAAVSPFLLHASIADASPQARNSSESNSANPARNIADAGLEHKSRRLALWIALILTLSLGVGLGILQFLKSPPKETQSHSYNGLRNAPRIDLKFQVVAQADRLQVEWDHQNPIVRSAVRGYLHVIDGPQSYQIPLDLSQIHQGGMVYKPLTADVIFELEIADDRDRTANALIRYVDGTRFPRTDSLASKPVTDVRAPSSAGIDGSRNAAARLAVAQPPLTGKGSYGDNLQQPNALNPVSAISADANHPAVEASSNAPLGPVQTSSVSLPISTRAAAPVSGAKPNLTGGTTDSFVPSISSRQTMFQLPNLSASHPQNGPQTTARPKLESTQRLPATGDVTNKRTVIPANSTAKSKALYVPPVPLREALPDYLGGKIVFYKNIEVEVKVTLDKFGYVKEAHVENSAEKLNLALIGLVTATAKQWRFRPASRDGEAVPSEYRIIFRFHP